MIHKTKFFICTIFVVLSFFSFSFISSTSVGTLDWTEGKVVYTPAAAIAAAVSSFLGLDDTPSSFSGEGNNCVKVNAGETALVFGACGTGGTDTWGGNQSNYVNYSRLSENDYGWYNDTDFDIADYPTHDNVIGNQTTSINDTFNGNYSTTLNYTIGATHNNVIGNQTTSINDTFAGNYSSVLNYTIGATHENVIANLSGDDLVGQNSTFTGTNYTTNINTTNIGDYNFTGNTTQFEQEPDGTISIIYSWVVDLINSVIGSTYATNDNVNANSSNIRTTIEENITDHEENYKHGNTSAEIWAIADNETFVKTVNGSNAYPVYVNLTSATYSGNISNGTHEGYKRANDICEGEYEGSHMCNEFEIAEWYGNNGYAEDVDNEDAWIIAGSPKYIPATVPVNDCHGWTYNGTTEHLGNYWHFNKLTGGDGRALNCGTYLELACCSY